MENLNDDIKSWGIVELMGHKVVAGMVSKSEMLGKPMLRVDVPATSAYGEFTQFYGEAAIYCVTFVSEEVARRTAEANKTNPVSVYVPDLITVERHDKEIQAYREQIARLNRGLPAPNGGYTCTWIQEENQDSNTWSTSCGREWELTDGTPMENDIQYCVFCGRSVRTVDGSDQDDEAED